ncbi:hypothetical protein PW86_23890 [Salmonella enterica subsp. enterica serovar Agona]|uniref:Uncharacterized protein n=3 Tax=Salmonella enterica TaxID=28901 RepID=A0A736GTM0_SALET|nr:hypothetical protein [Proteus mirabilis]EAA3244561.1 hypothetical protein [Salmonella enterica subsp. enterica serovar Virchow]EAA6773007.1 hypothetical protein [Salmonella enterica subsp. enterica serovar Agona]EAM8714292.1 hypothetical protein [Salmonella enterica]EBF6393473.1 hypothetical protein [Salmonella enterica subsp. enterica serovar Haifa]EBG0671285.1 hypothetical protein [Salmonella enterica subsp. enterica serovar Indiana]EBS5869951.1 hypothetical protein [Salmonella enterica 
MGSCAAPSAKGDDKFITTDYLQQCRDNLFYHRLSLLAAQILALAFQEVRAIRMALESLVKELSREHR